MAGNLTEEELSWLDSIFGTVNEELNETLAKLGSSPLAHTLPPVGVSSLGAHTERLRRDLIKRAHADNFIVLEALGRVRLSKETRKAEMKRLKRLHTKRKKYTFRYGRKHNKLKAQTKARQNEKRWADDPYMRIKYTSRKPFHITREDWDRCIQPVWEKYPRKQLKISGGDKENGYTVHNIILTYRPHREKYSRTTPKPVVVYSGYDQAVYDSMVKAATK